MVEEVKTSELIRNPDFHARQGKTDPMHVQRLVDALEAGADLPPVIACRLRKIVVEGWHRIEAYEKYYGADEAKIRVEWRDYADEAALYMDALAYAADSKLALSHYNQQSCVIRAQALGIMPDKVAGLLKVPEGKLAKRVVTAVERRSGDIIPLKAPFSNLAGTQLTEEQRVVNERADGRSVKWHADQISSRLRNNMLEGSWSNAQMVKSLLELRDLLISESQLQLPPEDDVAEIGA